MSKETETAVEKVTVVEKRKAPSPKTSSPNDDNRYYETSPNCFIHLNRLVMDGEIGDAIGWHDEVAGLAKVLGRSSRRNIMYYGQPQSGKLAVLKALAYRSLKDPEYNKALGNVQYYMVDFSLIQETLVAITTSKPKKMGITRRDVDPDRETLIDGFFIDFIHSVEDYDQEVVLIVPKCDGYDSEFLGRGIEKIYEFTKGYCTLIFDLDIDENVLQNEHTESYGTKQIRKVVPSGSSKHMRRKKDDVALQMLQTNSTQYWHKEPDKTTVELFQSAIVDKLEEYHCVKYSSPALKQAKEYVANAEKYKTYIEKLDVLRDILDEAAASARFENPVKWERDSLGGALITEELIAVSKKEVQEAIKANFGDVETIRAMIATTAWTRKVDAIKGKVKGQDEIIDRVMPVIRIGLSALKTPAKPVGSFMFAGTTGVGKTYLCQNIAKQLNLPMIRIDMSEFQQEHFVSRFIGSPPGYVGSREGGQLTNWAKRYPRSVILLDEIDKAHPDILDALLQVLDAGRLTSGVGEEVDMTQSIVVMTTNFGAKDVASVNKRVGFGDAEVDMSGDVEHAVRTALEKELRPEFINRFDDILIFNPVSKDVMHNLVAQKFNELSKFAVTQGVEITYSKKIIELFAIIGYDEAYGVRPLQRKINGLVQGKVATLHADSRKSRLKVKVTTPLTSAQIKSATPEELEEAVVVKEAIERVGIRFPKAHLSSPVVCMLLGRRGGFRTSG
jgi:ATP-dependent Clp protease ATP-binding subunit ClpA